MSDRARSLTDRQCIVIVLTGISRGRADNRHGRDPSLEKLRQPGPSHCMDHRSLLLSPSIDVDAHESASKQRWTLTHNWFIQLVHVMDMYWILLP